MQGCPASVCFFFSASQRNPNPNQTSYCLLQLLQRKWAFGAFRGAEDFSIDGTYPEFIMAQIPLCSMWGNHIAACVGYGFLIHWFGTEEATICYQRCHAFSQMRSRSVILVTICIPARFLLVSIHPVIAWDNWVAVLWNNIVLPKKWLLQHW